MDISAIKTRLAAIQEQITGVKRAYANGPMTIPESDLPIFVNFTGPGTPNGYSDHALPERTFIMRLYVAPAQNGIDGEAESRCNPFFERVEAAFLARPGLSLGVSGSGPLDGVLDTTYLGDGGTVLLPYAGNQYIGIEFRVRVVSVSDIDEVRYE